MVRIGAGDRWDSLYCDESIVAMYSSGMKMSDIETFVDEHFVLDARQSETTWNWNVVNATSSFL